MVIYALQSRRKSVNNKDCHIDLPDGLIDSHFNQLIEYLANKLKNNNMFSFRAEILFFVGVLLSMFISCSYEVSERGKNTQLPNDTIDELIMYVGTYTEKEAHVDGKAEGIYPDMPFIFLTARSQQEDILKGLQLGADDYIKKPFSMEELKLRLDAILRRADNGEPKKEKFSLGDYEFDYPLQQIKY